MEAIQTDLYMNLNPVQDGHFWGCSRMGPFLGHISYNDETWHSYTLPREDQKKYESRDTSISDISIFSPEISKFCASVTVTKSRIFKILNLTKKSDRNFRGTFLKNHFRHLKLYSNPPSWLARSRCHMGTFWKTKDWSSHFWESQPFRFWYVEFTAKEDLNRRKQVFLLDFRPWLAQKPKIWSIFNGQKFI